MNKTKNIFLAIIIIFIVGSIWYLESIKTNPIGNQGAPAQPIVGVPASTSTNAAGGKISIASIAAEDIKNGLKPAVEITNPTGFINTPPFKLADLVGKKVVLLDFWTYSCINCLRTLPYLTSWYQKYQNEGLEIVGIHTPEFDFEKDYSNVSAAVAKYSIKYPVVMDSNYGTWQAYGNLYWPHEYLIDAAGYIVHDQIGEGGYQDTEAEIQKLLQERAEALGIATSSAATSSIIIPQENLSGIGSEETYFGAARNEFLANGNQSSLGDQTLQEPSTIDLNKLYLAGNWNFQSEYAQNTGPAKIIYRYSSSKVFFVASGNGSGVSVKVLQDGVPVSTDAGSDVKDGVITIKESRLYNVINNSQGSGEHTLELIIDSPGLQAYTFTFG